MIRIFTILSVVALFCSGCFRRPVESEPETVTTLTILSTKATNEGAPLYIVLKFTDFAGFLVDDYQTVADLSCAPVTNSSFTTFCLIPGRKETRIARPPPGQSTAIYCLFTKCGEKWKHLIHVDEYCKEAIITLGEHEINSVELR
ncbi:MAG: hypothetical protein LLG04_13495 [Parachlamydia sp.]|nr:hypothetical protein [Parachlamydia sp.]